MSANNGLYIRKQKDGSFQVTDEDVESGSGPVVASAPTLEEAVTKANSYMADNIVEYGLHIELEPACNGEPSNKDSSGTS